MPNLHEETETLLSIGFLIPRVLKANSGKSLVDTGYSVEAKSYNSEINNEGSISSITSTILFLKLDNEYTYECLNSFIANALITKLEMDALVLNRSREVGFPQFFIGISDDPESVLRELKAYASASVLTDLDRYINTGELPIKSQSPSSAHQEFTPKEFKRKCCCIF
jgi:hypothetical protein